jgi:hypothetical protein
MRRFTFHRFANSGFGWFCKACSAASEPREHSEGVPSRLFLEGEADKTASISRKGRAVWKSIESGILFCPDCEEIENGVAGDSPNKETT